MKIALIYLKGKTEPWSEEACENYAKKIAGYLPFERIAVKAKSLDRDNAAEKKNLEAEALMRKTQKSDLVILFDENGREFKSSHEFSNAFVQMLGRQSKRVVFAIGGAYGFTEDARQQAQAVWSLSPLTMNHHLAQVTALEQIYRALTIWKNFPYHN